MKEAREFWIAEAESEDVIEDSDTKCWARMEDWSAENIERIHVIEYSAYEALERKLEIAREALEECNHIANYKNAFEYAGDITKVTIEALKKLGAKYNDQEGE